MKKITLFLLTAVLLLSFVPAQSKAIAAVNTLTNTSSPGETTVLNARIDQINAMDKSNMSFSEKKQLRKEVRSSKRELRAIGGGVYISAGAIILILVLLIIFL